VQFLSSFDVIDYVKVGNGPKILFGSVLKRDGIESIRAVRWRVFLAQTNTIVLFFFVNSKPISFYIGIWKSGNVTSDQ